MKYTIWYGEDKEQARYLVKLLGLRAESYEINRIRPTGRDFVENPDALQRILYLDRPDLVVCVGDPPRPVFALEFCGEAPSGHNISQRMARVAAAAEAGTPCAFVFPQRKQIERNPECGPNVRWDEFNPLPLRVLTQISRFHATPALAFFWPADERRGDPALGRLLRDTQFRNLPPRSCTEMRDLAAFATLALEYGLTRRPASELVFEPVCMEREHLMSSRYHQRAEAEARWSPLTSTKTLTSTDALRNVILQQTRISVGLPPHIAARGESVLYQPHVTTFRADPYAGNLVAIDYHECRNGPTPRHRYRNLVMNFKEVPFSAAASKFEGFYRRTCPLRPGNYQKADRFLTLHLRDGCRYTKQKELRIFCYLADLVLFKDAVLY